MKAPPITEDVEFDAFFIKPYHPEDIASWIRRRQTSTRDNAEKRVRMNSLPDTSKPQVETVLVLEDDVLIRMPICQYLRDCGYRVLEAASADEATVILRKQDIHVDVILSDIEMRGTMNGFAFAQWVRSARPGVDIVLAGTPERAAHAAGELCENGPMLMKPYDHQIVLDRIKRLLAARARQGEN